MSLSFTTLTMRAALAGAAAITMLALPTSALSVDLPSVDRNDDAEVGRVEYLNHLGESFFLVDGNKDGRVTSNELRQAAGAIPPERFEAIDVDNNGTLDIHELQRALSRDFDAADTDHDGVISTEEFNRYFR